MKKPILVTIVLILVLACLHFYTTKNTDTEKGMDNDTQIQNDPSGNKRGKEKASRVYKSTGEEKYSFNIPNGFVVDESRQNVITLYKDVLDLGKNPASYIFFIVLSTDSYTINGGTDLSLDFFENFKENETKRIKLITNAGKDKNEDENENSEKENNGTTKKTPKEEYSEYTRDSDVEVGGFNAKKFINEHAVGFEEDTKEIILLLTDSNENTYFFGAYLGNNTRDPYYFPEETVDNFIKDIEIF